MAYVVVREKLPSGLHQVYVQDDLSQFNENDHVLDADLSAVADLEAGKETVSSKYWKLPAVGGTVVIEMTAEEKAVVDNADLDVYKAEAKRALAAECFEYLISKCPAHNQTTLVGMHSVALQDNKNNRANYIKSFWNWLDSVVAYNRQQQDAVDAAVDETAVDAVTQDFSTYNGTWGSWTIAGARAIVD